MIKRLYLFVAIVSASAMAQVEPDGTSPVPLLKQPSVSGLDWEQMSPARAPLGHEGAALDRILAGAETGCFITIELMGAVPPGAASLARHAETLWASGSCEQARSEIKMLSLLVGPANIAIGVKGETAAASLGKVTGSDVRVGTADSLTECALQIDQSNNNLFALLLHEVPNSYWWSLNLSTDGGVTWTQTYKWSSTIPIGRTSLAISDGFAYVAYLANSQREARVRRFNSLDGKDSTFADLSAYVTISTVTAPDLFKEITLISNHAASATKRLYLFGLTDSKRISAFWNNTDSVSWAEFPTNIGNALGGLSAAFNFGPGGFYSSPHLWVSCIDTTGNIRIDSSDAGGAFHSAFAWPAYSSASFPGLSLPMTSLSAYKDTILCAYGHAGVSYNYCRYWISYGAGRTTWKYSPVGGDSSITSEAAAVTLEGGGGMGIMYRYYTAPRQGRFTWRAYPQGSPWSNPITYADYSPYWNRPSVVYMGGGKFGLLYLTLSSPSVRCAFFDTYSVVTGIAEAPGSKPSTFVLGQNYPNPFNPVTTIQYQLAVSGSVKLKVYDVLGREVRTLVDGILPSGSHEARFDATDLASGVYFYRLVSAGFTDTKKMVLAR